jgi:hypothetical protein
VEAHQTRLAACAGKPPPSLAEPSPEVCSQLVAEAREWVAIHVVDW